ncbi:MAG: hypothetical protein GX162_06605 [Firmicutes bacterium]|nr:hypothetical protein [Bacillota bacterium]
MAWGSWGSWGYSTSYDEPPEPRRREPEPLYPICSDCGRPRDPRVHRCPQMHTRRLGDEYSSHEPHDAYDDHERDDRLEGHEYRRDRPPQERRELRDHREHREHNGHRANGRNSRRRPHDDRLRVKTLIVIAEECVQKVGSHTIQAPVGVGVDKHGKLTHPVRLEAVGDPVFNPTILEDKLINEGFIRARLIVDDPDPCPDAQKAITQLVTIPFQTVHDIPGIKPGDHIQEFSKIEALLVSATPVSCIADSTTMVSLALKIVLKVDVIIARECIISVPAKILRCMPSA